MKAPLIIAGTLLLTACFSEDMKNSQLQSEPESAEILASLTLPSANSSKIQPDN